MMKSTDDYSVIVKIKAAGRQNKAKEENMTDFQLQRLTDDSVNNADKCKTVYGLCLIDGSYHPEEAEQYLELIPDDDIRDEYKAFEHTQEERNHKAFKAAGAELKKIQSEKTESIPQLCCVADVKKKDLQFLLEPYIIKNNITAIVGDGGVGKTYIWIDIASAITQNRMPHVMAKSKGKKPKTSNNKVLYMRKN